MESGAQEALDKRNEGEGPLVVEFDQLQAKSDAVKAQIEENKIHKEKLMAVIAYCQRIKQLPPTSKATAFERKTLEKNLKEVMEEVKMADDFLKRAKTKVVGRVDDVILVF